MRARSRATYAALAILLASGPARAGDPAATFGLHTQPAALGGAAGAVAVPSSAAFVNPAAAALGDGLSIKLGYVFSHPMLSYNGEMADVQEAHGVALGLRIPLFTISPRGKAIRLALGLGLYIPDRWIARMYLIEPTRPSFVMWEGPVHRLVATPLLAVSFADLVSVGVGVTMLADGAGTASLELGYEGSQTRTDAELDLNLRLRTAPVIGISVQPMRYFTIAAGWAGELSLDLALDVAADLSAPGVEGDTMISIRGTNDYTPHTIWAALSVHPIEQLDIDVQGSWVMWSRAAPFHAQMRMILDLGGDISTIGDVVPAGGLSDSFVLAVGVEGRIPLLVKHTLALRAGYQYRPTPVPAQTGFTSYADSDVHLVATGIGFTASLPGNLTLKLGWAMQLQRLVPRSVVKDPDVFDSVGFEIEGWVIATMIDFEITFGPKSD
jgi:hypothetical protein